MASDNDYARSRIAFRPSVYATGLQQVQPYTPIWPQGSDYGEASWYAPWSWHEYLQDPQEGAVGGTCKDHQGLLGTPGAMVSCAALSDAQAGRAPGTTQAYVPDQGVVASLLPDISIDIPDWAPDFLKDDEELEEERLRREEEEKEKFKRRLIFAGLGMATVLGGIFLYQRGEKKKIEAGGDL